MPIPKALWSSPRRKVHFIDLFHPLEAAKLAEPTVRLTTNGLLLTRAGYAIAAKATEEQLGLPPRRWQVHVDWTGKIVACEGVKIKALEGAATSLRFEAVAAILPVAEPAEANMLRITGLPPGKYRLKVDGQEILQASAAEWATVSTSAKARLSLTPKNCTALVLRNQTFYRRWRPYNDHSRHWTYIDIDFKLYDVEIAKEEQHIAELRKPEGACLQDHRRR